MSANFIMFTVAVICLIDVIAAFIFARMIVNRRNEISRLQLSIDMNTEELHECKNLIYDNSIMIKSGEEMQDSFSKSLDDMQNQIDEHNEVIEDMQLQIDSMEQTINEHNEVIEDMQLQIDEQDEVIGMQLQIDSMEQTINEHNEAIEDMRLFIKNMQTPSNQICGCDCDCDNDCYQNEDSVPNIANLLEDIRLSCAIITKKIDLLSLEIDDEE